MFEKFSDQIAAVILEPITGNMGVIDPGKDYLDFLREITRENGSLLIFDEVMTGFRIARGGAQELYDIKPDLSAFGKIIGGGDARWSLCRKKRNYGLCSSRWSGLSGRDSFR